MGGKLGGLPSVARAGHWGRHPHLKVLANIASPEHTILTLKEPSHRKDYYYCSG